MMHRLYLPGWRVGWFLGLTLIASTGETLAALGQLPLSSSSSQSAAPRAKMLATTPAAAQAALYTLHEVQMEDGATIREFANPQGVVFAVSWRGPVLPDLNALLGAYFKTFSQETEQARLHGRRGSPVNIEQKGLVVRSNGRMRNFFGHAYVPELVPAAVNIKDVLQ